MQSTANEHSVIVLKNNYMHINVDLPPLASAARRFNGSKSHFNVAERQRSKYVFSSLLKPNLRPFRRAARLCSSAALQLHSLCLKKEQLATSAAKHGSSL